MADEEYQEFLGSEQYLEHPEFVLPEEPEEETEDLGPTWWVLDKEPGMDDLAGPVANAGVLKKMQDSLKIFPFQDRDGNDRLFLMRFEIPKYGEDFQFPEAVFTDKKPGAWLHLLGGFPIDCVEKLIAIGEYSTQAKDVIVKAGEGKAAPPVPDKFFEWPDTTKVLLNLTALPTKDFTKILAPNLSGEPKPVRAHWWLGTNLPQEDGAGKPVKWPLPGEFLGLGVCLFPDIGWGHQKSSPFVWSGNWVSTIWYDSAVIKEIIDPTADVPYPTYTVIWHGQEIKNVRPSDWSEYKVDDRVTILKDVAATKVSELWKDDDMKNWGDNWVLAPISFYGLDRPQEA